ncbi:Hypothetical predicted protein [Marmota monax]|uniref:Uncharacterized protein n=1 Tax=Marmota monax TaxID=9995 RepID=A0A5E4AXJ5_MARMO|nr:Hypothetical predicted protein [Marmota monax]
MCCSFSEAVQRAKAFTPLGLITRNEGELGHNGSPPSLGPELAQNTHFPYHPRQTDAGALHQRTGVGWDDSPALSLPTAWLQALGNQNTFLGKTRKALLRDSSLGSCKSANVGPCLDVQSPGQ